MQYAIVKIMIVVPANENPTEIEIKQAMNEAIQAIDGTVMDAGRWTMRVLSVEKVT